MFRKRHGLAFCAAALVVLSGCSGGIPADPDGTLERVTDGTLRVGVSHNPPWVDLGVEGEPTGSEVALVRRFAEQIDADIEWTDSSEAPLVDALDRGELDLLIAGFVADTPWSEKAAVTRPFAEIANSRGEREKHVMLAPMGENAFLVALERFLLSGQAQP